MGKILALGDQHWLRFVKWAPDRKLNPQFAHLPDVELYGAVVSHIKKDETLCEGTVMFDGPVQNELEPERDKWIVHSWDPLTLSPSLQCHCGDHGFIQVGKWVRA